VGGVFYSVVSNRRQPVGEGGRRYKTNAGKGEDLRPRGLIVGLHPSSALLGVLDYKNMGHVIWDP